MTNEQYYNEIKSMSESMKNLEIGMSNLNTEFKNHRERQEERTNMLLKAIEEAKEARKVIHKEQDKFDDRLNVIEASPVFKEWETIKKQLSGWLWKGIGVFLLVLIIRAVPDIIRMVKG